MHGRRWLLALAWAVAGTLAVAAVGLGVWRARVAQGEPVVPPDAAYPPPGATPRLPPGIPPGIVATPTPTPDLRAVRGAAAVAAELRGEPGVGPVLAAVLAGDVEGFLDLLPWEPRPCGVGRATVSCPPGVAPGTDLPMFDLGGGPQFWVTREYLRARVAPLLEGGRLRLVFVSRSPELSGALQPSINAPQSRGRVYLLGFEGASVPAATGGPPSEVPITHTGLLVAVDGGAEHPVVRLSWVQDVTSVLKVAYQFGLNQGRHEILVLEPEAAR